MSTPLSKNIVHRSDKQGRKEKKAEVLHFLRGNFQVYEIPAQLGGKPILALLDTGATTSLVAKSCVPENSIVKCDAKPMQVRNGDLLWSLGTVYVNLALGKPQTCFQLKAVVVDTPSFDVVLGADFTNSEQIGGLLTQPSRLLVNGQEIPLVHRPSTLPINNRLFRLFKTESYSLVNQLRDQVLSDLEIDPKCIFIDVFGNHLNHQEELYLTRENSAWRYNWGKLIRSEKDYLWANPPFSQLVRVVTKLCLHPTTMVLVHPDWHDQFWSPILRTVLCC